MEIKTLSDKQKKFCECFIESLNPTQAAKKSGYNRSTAWRLLCEPHINAYINKLKDENIDLSQYLSLSEIINFHVRVIKSDYKDYLTFGTTKDGKSYVKLKNSSEVDGTIIQEITQGKDGIRIKLIDKKYSIDVVSKLLDKYKLEVGKIDKIEDIKNYLSELLSKSCELSEVTIRNQLNISGKIIECFKTDHDEKIAQLEEILKELQENRDN